MREFLLYSRHQNNDLINLDITVFKRAGSVYQPFIFLQSPIRLSMLFISLYYDHFKQNIIHQAHYKNQEPPPAMSTKPSQLFMYFQNKAHHYQNIQTAKSKVEDRLEDSINESIDYISKHKYDRDFPQSKQYEIKLQNNHMSRRLASIQTTHRKQIEVNGNYSRYNSFERKFRTKNKAQVEIDRQRQIKNSKIQEKIKYMKPQIGSHKYWQEDYQEKTKMRRSVIPSKGHLLLQKKSFMAEAYLDFLNQINGNDDKSPKDVSTSRSSKAEEKIAIERLFVLPSLVMKKSGKIKNNQLTINNDHVETNLENKEQQKEEK